MPFGRQTWSWFATIAKPFFQSDMRWRALGLFALLLTLLLSLSGLNVFNSYVNRDWMTALEQRNGHAFFSLTLVYAGMFALLTVVAVFLRFTEEKLGLVWRRWLTRHLTDRYLAGHTYYWIKSRGDIDNPDQRIADDVKTFTTTTLALTLILLNSTITLCAFSGILWSITPWLFLATAGYAVFGTLLTVFLGRRLVGLDNLQLKKEADLRYELIRVRENAESIALLRGERQENGRLRRRVQAMVDNFRVIIGLNRKLGFFTIGYNYLIQIVPVLVVAPLYIRGEAEFGSVTQAMVAFGHVLNAMTVIVTQFQVISAFAAVIERLGGVWEVLDRQPAPAKASIEVTEDKNRVACERLTLVTPRQGRLLVRDLALEIPHGKRLLVMGPGGSGKTALLRAAAGLWQAGQGRIIRPPLDEVLFLPQQPYLALGTLRDQLLYGVREGQVPDDDILRALRQVHFEPVLERVGGLDVEQDWPGTLCRGEQQLLAFARLLLADPRFAFLDEATSALESDETLRLYEVLSRTPISYVSVAKDNRLRAYHDLLLELEGQGAWKTTPADVTRDGAASTTRLFDGGLRGEQEPGVLPHRSLAIAAESVIEPEDL